MAVKIVRVLILKPSNDGRGNVWRKGQEYEVTQKTADRLVGRGAARYYVNHLAEKLALYGVGILVNDQTDPDLLAAAEKGVIPVINVSAMDKLSEGDAIELPESPRVRELDEKVDPRRGKVLDEKELAALEKQQKLDSKKAERKVLSDRKKELQRQIKNITAEEKEIDE